MSSKCRICKREAYSANTLRFGVCFRCAEAESIIDTGLDMYDKGLMNGDSPAVTAMDKVRLLAQRGILRSGNAVIQRDLV